MEENSGPTSQWMCGCTRDNITRIYIELDTPCISKDHQLEEPLNRSSHQQWELKPVGAPQVNQRLVPPPDSFSSIFESPTARHSPTLQILAGQTLQYPKLAYLGIGVDPRLTATSARTCLLLA